MRVEVLTMAGRKEDVLIVSVLVALDLGCKNKL